MDVNEVLIRRPTATVFSFVKLDSYRNHNCANFQFKSFKIC